MIPPSSSPPASTSDPIKVLLVDDSTIVRAFIARTLEADPDIKIVASVPNGQMGVTAAARHHPDIVVLDVEMPIMDGIEALPKIIEASPGTKVLMCSTLTARNAEITMKAFQLGAADCIAKPTNSGEINAADSFKVDLLRMVKLIGRRAQRAMPKSPSDQAQAQAQPQDPKHTFAGGQHGALKSKTPFELRPTKIGDTFHPAVLAIGSSTGGPQALFKVISHFKNLPVPIILTQHMPATFTKILAQHIQDQTGVRAFEGQDGMAVENGTVYVAPGGFHMTFRRADAKTVIQLDSGPPENYCKPSVDPMIRSAMAIWGSRILCVILTGMGSDGLHSCKALADAGGKVVAQDQETSVVWGMPGAVAVAGVCSAVLPLQDIGPWVRQKL
jgi:two-component system, chemotaxis family, protein-glutamate methylesterase/glutaminase